MQSKSQSPCSSVQDPSAVSRGPLNSSYHPSLSLISTHTGFSAVKKKICQDLCYIRIFATAVHSAQDDFPSNIHSPHSFSSFKFCLSISFTIETYWYILFIAATCPTLQSTYRLLTYNSVFFSYSLCLLSLSIFGMLSSLRVRIFDLFTDVSQELALKELLLNSFIK